MHQSVRGFNEIINFFLWRASAWQQPKYLLLSNFKIDFLKNQ